METSLWPEEASLSTFVGIRSAELYDPASGSWVATGSMLSERRGFTLTLLPNGTVLAAGGFGTNLTVSTAELYDPARGIWTPTDSLQTRRASHTATLLPDGRVLVVGGNSLTSAEEISVPFDPVLASAEIYDPTTGIWTPTGYMGQPRQHHTATLLTNGKVLVAGGDSYFGGVLPTTAEVYDPDTGNGRSRCLWSAGAASISPLCSPTERFWLREVLTPVTPVSPLSFLILRAQWKQRRFC